VAAFPFGGAFYRIASLSTPLSSFRLVLVPAESGQRVVRLRGHRVGLGAADTDGVRTGVGSQASSRRRDLPCVRACRCLGLGSLATLVLISGAVRLVKRCFPLTNSSAQRTLVCPTQRPLHLGLLAISLVRFRVRERYRLVYADVKRGPSSASPGGQPTESAR
jgi:hypothetical protein